MRQAARICASVQDSFLAAAVIAERVCGTSWETIADVLRREAADVQEQWERREERWRHAFPGGQPPARGPRYYVAKADRYITTDAPYQCGTATRLPLSESLDAGAHPTGRDVGAANRAFAGTACTHCSHWPQARRTRRHWQDLPSSVRPFTYDRSWGLAVVVRVHEKSLRLGSVGVRGDAEVRA